MAKTLLTTAAVERMRKPKSSRIEISDAEPGLFLWVTPNGTKSWAVIYRLPADDGKRTIRRKTVIGRFPEMSLTDARETARGILALARQGIDPERHEAELAATSEREAQERAANTFRAVVEMYEAAMNAGQMTGGRQRPVTQRTARGRMSMLNRLVLPELADKSLASITPQDVSRLLAKIERDAGPVDETLKTIRSVFKFAVSRGLFQGVLPTAGMSPRQPPVKEVRALSDDEIKALWKAASACGYPFGHIIKLLLLTGQRRTEIAEARWDELDWERKLLTIPAERIKNRAAAHEIALSTAALAILQDAQKAHAGIGSTSSLIFPSAAGDTPISGWSKLKPRLTRMMDEPFSWRIHDLRHTFITRCRDGEENEHGELTWSAPLDVLQAAVNHKLTAGVTATYDHGDIQRRYRLRKRELMEWWSRKLLNIVEGVAEDNVVQMPLAVI